MRASKKVFFCVGLPLLGFMIFIAINYYVRDLVWFITFGVLGFVTFYRRNRKYIGLTKVGFVMLLWFFVICSNPIHLPAQVYRHINRGTLIRPYAEGIVDLSNNFTSSAFYQGPYNRSTIQGQIEELYDIQSFIHNADGTGYLEYIWDFHQYGVFDHLPTPEEVLATRQDDCDGITVVTVSLLVLLGYEAYIAESDLHRWTYVRIYGEDLNDTVAGQTSTVVYLEWWESIGEPYVIFNQTHVIIMQPLYVSWVDQMIGGYFIWALREIGFSLLESLFIKILLVPTIVLVGFLFAFGVGFPRHYPKKRMYLANAIMAILVLGILLSMVLLCPESFWPYEIPILLISIGVLIVTIDRDYITKRIWKPQN